MAVTLWLSITAVTILELFHSRTFSFKPENVCKKYR